MDNTFLGILEKNHSDSDESVLGAAQPWKKTASCPFSIWFTSVLLPTVGIISNISLVGPSTYMKLCQGYSVCNPESLFLLQGNHWVKGMIIPLCSVVVSFSSTDLNYPILALLVLLSDVLHNQSNTANSSFSLRENFKPSM